LRSLFEEGETLPLQATVALGSVLTGVGMTKG
jgi:hypothetical protein